MLTRVALTLRMTRPRGRETQRLAFILTEQSVVGPGRADWSFVTQQRVHITFRQHGQVRGTESPVTHCLHPLPNSFLSTPVTCKRRQVLPSVTDADAAAHLREREKQMHLSLSLSHWPDDRSLMHLQLVPSLIVEEQTTQHLTARLLSSCYFLVHVISFQ